jgi:hypothetical protein
MNYSPPNDGRVKLPIVATQSRFIKSWNTILLGVVFSWRRKALQYLSRFIQTAGPVYDIGGNAPGIARLYYLFFIPDGQFQGAFQNRADLLVGVGVLGNLCTHGNVKNNHAHLFAGEGFDVDTRDQRLMIEVFYCVVVQGISFLYN